MNFFNDDILQIIEKKNDLSGLINIFPFHENSIRKLNNILENYKKNTKKLNYIFLFYYKGQGITTILKNLSDIIEWKFGTFDNSTLYYQSDIKDFMEGFDENSILEIKEFDSFSNGSLIHNIINPCLINMNTNVKITFIFPIEAPVSVKLIDKYSIEELVLLMKQKNDEKQKNSEGHIPEHAWDLITERNSIIFKKLDTNNLLSIIRKEMDIFIKHEKVRIKSKQPDILKSVATFILLSKGYPTLREISGLGKMMIENLISESDSKKFSIDFDDSCRDIFSNISISIEKEAEKLENTNSELYYEYDYDKDNNIFTFKNFKIKILMVAKNKNLYTYQDIKFNDVIGHEDVKERFKEILKFFNNPESFKKFDLVPPLKILLHGPPGTGKTMLAKALAGESGLPFFAFSLPELTSQKYAGWGAASLRQVFKDVETYSPCILFFDEIDAIGNRNSADLQENKIILNNFLTLIDGISSRSDLILIAATNRIQDIDEALIRPGRFGTQIFVSALLKKEREKFIKMKVKKDYCNVNEYDKIIENIVDATRGISNAAKLQEIIDEVKLYFIRSGQDKIKLSVLNIIMDEFIYGEKRNVRIDELQKKKTTYHESGHVIIAKSLMPDKEIKRISIGFRKTTLGFTEFSYEEESDLSNLSFDNIITLIIILMGGIAAEKIYFNNWDMGGGSDFSKATALAKAVVTNYDLNVGLDTIISSHINDGKNDLVQEYAVTLIEFCIDQAKKILKSNNEILDVLVEKLIKDEDMDKKEAKYFFDKNEIKPFSISEIVNNVLTGFSIKYRNY